MTTPIPRVVLIEPGQMATITLGSSDVCAHMGVAGTIMQVVLLYSAENRTPLVQLYRDGHPFSFPLLPSEAGVYRHSNGRFYGLLYTRVQPTP